MKEFPILYEKNDNGKVRFWKISVNDKNGKVKIAKEYGRIDGKITKPEPKEIIHKGTITSLT